MLDTVVNASGSQCRRSPRESNRFDGLLDATYNFVNKVTIW
jgi:hypothetical protein